MSGFSGIEITALQFNKLRSLLMTHFLPSFDRLKQILTQPPSQLPNLSKLMHNPDFDIPTRSSPLVLRRAAVLITLCYPTERPDRTSDIEQNGTYLEESISPEDIQLLLTVRHTNLQHHAGQVALPGGTQEPQDKTLFDTAKRETEEETGLTAALLEHPQQLPDFISLSGFRITPFVALAPSYALNTLEADPNEVGAIFTLPLTRLLDPKRYQLHRVTHKREARAFFEIPDTPHRVWGVTAGILNGFQQWLAQANQSGT
jgi:8-oxo-dGTP pyrophosphatase MutT (NUDIX family)